MIPIVLTRAPRGINAEGRKNFFPAAPKNLGDHQRIQDALSSAAKDMTAYCLEHPEFKDIKQRMSTEWSLGSRSLNLKTVEK